MRQMIQKYKYKCSNLNGKSSGEDLKIFGDASRQRYALPQHEREFRGPVHAEEAR